MRREVLALNEGDVVLQIPARLAARSRRQLEAWMSVVLQSLVVAEDATREPPGGDRAIRLVVR